MFLLPPRHISLHVRRHASFHSALHYWHVRIQDKDSGGFGEIFDRKDATFPVADHPTLSQVQVSFEWLRRRGMVLKETLTSFEEPK